ncbi:glycosyltransferase family 2 protein [Acetobacter conturbans]|uniref:Glycosyltransferase family 2 protein n=1 Tax=Acetobacter conturbans TaxID=1737472 RepID=A0ABX0JY15_9PROT|nr:glycosyltransferase family 2 protein [Acetobacter conturbans]NHN88244.1 glycosyltransferase family 2 protein [Acetobacter conturbans]
MNSSLPSVAIALFVKNEFSDIAGWIAWHMAFGVKTLFIFEDHSSDGTWEIIQAAARCYDIRAVRTDPVAQPDFYLRQRDSFLAAAAECRGKYDWLGFLDGDEYLYLRHTSSLPQFLAGIPSDAAAIAFSWRIYGSSDKVVRPRVTAVEAFTQHSRAELGDNELVKSFVRPERMGQTYLNPHVFDVPGEDYVRPNGERVEHLVPVQPVDWSDAFVMHFICRSMEHYIQRIKRRMNSDLSDSQGEWRRFDHNDLTDSEPLRLLPAVHNALLPIYRAMVEDAITTLRQTAPLERHAGEVKAEIEKPRMVRVRSHLETYLYFAPATQEIVNATMGEADTHGLLPVFGAMFPSTPDMVTFFLPGHAGRNLKFAEDDRVSDQPIYRLYRLESGDTALMNPMNGLFACFIPSKEEEGYGRVEVNRHKINGWEQMKLEVVHGLDYPESRFTLPFSPNMRTESREILQWLVAAPVPPTVNAFLCMMYEVAPSVREEVSRRIPGLLFPFL